MQRRKQTFCFANEKLSIPTATPFYDPSLLQTTSYWCFCLCYMHFLATEKKMNSIEPVTQWRKPTSFSMNPGGKWIKIIIRWIVHKKRQRFAVKANSENGLNYTLENNKRKHDNRVLLWALFPPFGLHSLLRNCQYCVVAGWPMIMTTTFSNSWTMT